MKTEIVYIEKIHAEITFYIGTGPKDNFEVIDMGEPDDIWFHAKDESSCHVVVELPDDIQLDKSELKTIIKKGARLCKQHTNKLNNNKDTAFIYTPVKNVTKTKIAGCVLTKDTKIIIC